MKYLRQTLTLATVLIVSALVPALAMATIAANTRITNTVTVYYQNTSLTDQTPETASVDIVVALVVVAPTLTVAPGSDIDPADENTAQGAITYTITSNSNGPDTYNITEVDSTTNMDADAGVSYSSSSIPLGGTTMAVDATSGDTFITVPMDDDYLFASNATVNGLIEDDMIMIGGEEYTVGVIDKSTSYNAANNTVQIPITEVGGLTAPAAAAAAAGTLVSERTTFTATITTDSISATFATGEHSVVVRATSVDTASEFTDASAVTITVRRPLITVSKFVRNVDTLAAGTGPAVVVNGGSFYASGVSGQSGEEMQYLIIVDNSATGATDAVDVVVEDPIPAFTTFEPASIFLDADGSGTFVQQDEALDDGDAAEYDIAGNGTVYIYAGTGGDDTAPGINNVGDGGTVAAGDISQMVFSVTID